MKHDRIAFWGIVLGIFLWGNLCLAQFNFSPQPFQGSNLTSLGFLTTKVTSTDDKPDLSPTDGCADETGACTLRAAIQTVNAGGRGTTIILEANQTYVLKVDSESGGLDASRGDLDILKSMAIEVEGGGRATITTADAVRDGIFSVPAGSSLSLKNVFLVGGDNAGGAGGCINFEGGSAGTLNLDNVLLGGCDASGRGGALFVNGGIVNIRSSTFSNDKSGGGNGGAANFEGGATVKIENSLITDSSAPNGNGGGIAMGSGTLTLKNSTLSKNNSKNTGGALLVSQGTVNILNSSIFQNSAEAVGGGAIRVGQQATVDIQSSTISQNSGKNGGGLHLATPQAGQQNPSVSIVNTILAGNTAAEAGPDCNREAGSTVVLTSNGFNLMGDVSACGTSAGSNDRTANDPLLDTPVGSPPVLALKPDSPAVNNGSEGSCPGTDGIDQRGVPRPQPAGGRCDIGAFEIGVAAVAAPAPTPTPAPAPPAIPGAGAPTDSNAVPGAGGTPPPSAPTPSGGAGADEPRGGCSLEAEAVSGMGAFWGLILISLSWGFLRRIFRAR